MLRALALPTMALFAFGCATTQPARFEQVAAAMGTEWRIALYASDAADARAAFEACERRLAELDAIFSDYDDSSENGRFCALARDAAPTDWVALSPELFDVLARSEAIASATGGAFDVTIGPCSRLWRRSVRQEELPRSDHLAEALAAVGRDGVELDAATSRARLTKRGMRLDFGGIAKGWACDDLLRLLASHGIESALVDGGGDVSVSGPPPDRPGWRIALKPFDASRRAGRRSEAVELAHASIATSGDRYRYLEVDGVRYSHILDPRTGLGLTHRVAASVIAKDGATADALATALCVLGPDAGIKVLAKFPGVEARIATPDPEARESPGFAKWLAQQESSP